MNLKVGFVVVFILLIVVFGLFEIDEWKWRACLVSSYFWLELKQAKGLIQLWNILGLIPKKKSLF